MKRFFVFLFMLLATFSLASAQTIDIKGTVIDENGEPVIGASVMIKGTLKGDITDVSGRFSLGGVKTTDKLAVSCIGMIPVEVDPQAEMRITLKTDHEQLDEVLVVAFGQQTKSSFTGSAAVVKSETLEKKQLTNVMSGLQGQVAGLQMINNSGSPTATPSMAIRGFSSINAGTSPLIIVDGSPYDGGWNNLNPNDVENITVLKDAASNALYGARGANGVVMITTKKGKSEKATITFDSRWSVNSRATIDYDYVKDPAQYYEMHWSALYNYYMRDRGMTPYEAHRQANANLGGATADGGLGYLTYTVPDGEYLIGTNGRMNPHATRVEGFTTTERSIRQPLTAGLTRRSGTVSARNTTSISPEAPRNSVSTVPSAILTIKVSSITPTSRGLPSDSRPTTRPRTGSRWVRI